jgi:hypothetical protein
MPEKKSAWTDLDRVDFKKFVKQSSVEIKKSAWTGLDKVKKASSMASVSYECSIWGRQSVLHFDGLLLTRGAVVATPFADAYSLTFRPVKSTDALAS